MYLDSDFHNSLFNSRFFLTAPFVIGGTLKIVYYVALFLNFRNRKPPEEEQKI
jgi:hypothetical protein